MAEDTTNATDAKSKTGDGAGGPTAARLRTAAAERGRAFTAKVPQLAGVEDPKAAATAAWTAVRARKILVGGVTAGVVAAGTGSFCAGRRAALRRAGPLTRMTGGRL